MNESDLFRSFGEIDDQTLIDTETYRKHKNNSVMIRLIAASLTIILMVFGVSFLFPTENPDQTLSSWFVITAYTAEGDWTELGLNDGCFNSGETGQSIFPVDTPVFHFVVNPTKWSNNQSVYGNFSISISCDDQTIASLEDHVTVFHLIPVPGSNASYGYNVVGWFDKPTNITITVVDNSTGNLAEEITVHIQPEPDTGVYELKVIDIKTTDTK